jgi:hypothetical protein
LHRPEDKRQIQGRRKAKGGGNTHIEDTQRLVTEIEMLKVLLHLVVSNRQTSLKCNYVHQLLVAEDKELPKQPLKDKNILYGHNVS